MKASLNLWVLAGLTTLLGMASCGRKDAAAENPVPTPHYRVAYNVSVPDSLRPDDYEIFTIELDGSDKKRVTDHPDVAWTYLAHENRIYFISDRDTASRNYFLYEMQYDGSGVHKISDIRLQDSWMDVRKNGTELVVMPHPSVDSVFYLLSAEGKLLRKLPMPVPYVSDPAFSPDGEWLAFRGMNKRSKREAGFEEAIYVARLDGSELTQISNYPAQDTTAEWFAYKAGPPRWHPSGDFITYQSKRSGKYSLYAATPDGTREWKLTGNPQSEGWHSWSPDGKWLALDIFNVEETQFDIGLMDWETQKMTILTDSTFHYQQAPTFVEVR